MEHSVIRTFFVLLLTNALCYSAKIHTICDFDLENLKDILPYLPEECTKIYNERFTNAQLYRAHLGESQKFAIFLKKLDKYERRNIIDTDMETVEKYPFEAHLREEIYTGVDIAGCVITASYSAEQYLDCVMRKRLELIKRVPFV